MKNTLCTLIVLLSLPALAREEEWLEPEEHSNLPRYAVSLGGQYSHYRANWGGYPDLLGVQFKLGYDYFLTDGRHLSVGAHTGAEVTELFSPLIGLHLHGWIGPNQVLVPRLKLGLTADLRINTPTFPWEQGGVEGVLGGYVALEAGVRIRVTERLFFEAPFELGWASTVLFRGGLQCGFEF